MANSDERPPCDHEICDGNADDPSYAYCGLPAKPRWRPRKVGLLIMQDPHLFLPSFPGALECVVCGLPEGNARHNAREVKVDKRTRRSVYKSPRT